MNGVGDAGEPGRVFGQRPDFLRRNEFDAVDGRLSQRLQELLRDQNPDVIGMTVQDPGDVFVGQPGRWNSHHGEEAELLVIHMFCFGFGPVPTA